jgi:hypothetical protein
LCRPASEKNSPQLRKKKVPEASALPAGSLSERIFMKIKLHAADRLRPISSNFGGQYSLASVNVKREGYVMKRIALIAATAATLAVTAVTAPAPAEARGGFGPGLAGGLIAGALIGGIASSAYAYGPGYGYYGPGYGYYGGYAPAYYGGYDPGYYGYGYRRVYRPAYAYYGGPRYYGGWHRGWRHRW